MKISEYLEGLAKEAKETTHEYHQAQTRLEDFMDSLPKPLTTTVNAINREKRRELYTEMRRLIADRNRTQALAEAAYQRWEVERLDALRTEVQGFCYICFSPIAEECEHLG